MALNISLEKLEQSLGLITKHYSVNFLESTVGLGQALNAGEENELNGQALEGWRKVQSLYNEGIDVVKAFLDETQKFYNVGEYLNNKVDFGDVSSQVLDEQMSSIDESSIMFS